MIFDKTWECIKHYNVIRRLPDDYRHEQSHKPQEVSAKEARGQLAFKVCDQDRYPGGVFLM